MCVFFAFASCSPGRGSEICSQLAWLNASPLGVFRTQISVRDLDPDGKHSLRKNRVILHLPESEVQVLRSHRARRIQRGFAQGSLHSGPPHAAADRLRGIPDSQEDPADKLSSDGEADNLDPIDEGYHRTRRKTWPNLLLRYP